MKTIIYSLIAAFALTTMTAQEKPKKQYRSSVSGKYVTKDSAAKSPATTYRTARKKPAKKKP